MEIHFYESQQSLPTNVDQYYGWVDTVGAIIGGVEKIHTTQMGLLSTKLFEDRYRIFVHSCDGEMYEIKLGQNENTGRVIKMKNNLFNLWRTGEFINV